MVDDVLERLEERVVELAPSNETVSARDSESSISKEGRTRVT